MTSLLFPKWSHNDLRSKDDLPICIQDDNFFYIYINMHIHTFPFNYNDPTKISEAKMTSPFAFTKEELKMMQPDYKKPKAKKW